MSKVYADAVATPEPTDDLTLGGSGDNVIVTAGATLKTNTVKDSGGNTLFTSDGSGNLSSLNSGLKGNMVLLTTNTFTNATSSSFTSGIDSTYKLYIFKFYDINPATDRVTFATQFSTDGGSIVITGATSANPVVVTCSGGHKLKEGHQVTISGVSGITDINATWTVKDPTATTFKLYQAATAAIGDALGTQPATVNGSGYSSFSGSGMQAPSLA